MANFWENVVRYPRFFISSMIGLVIVITSPLKNLSENVNGRFIILLGIPITILSIVQIFIWMLEIEI